MRIATSAGPCDSPAVVSSSVTRGNPTAPRIAAIGAAFPVQNSNDAAPCATRTSSPSRRGRPRRAPRGRSPSPGTGDRRASVPGAAPRGRRLAPRSHSRRDPRPPSGATRPGARTGERAEAHRRTPSRSPRRRQLRAAPPRGPRGSPRRCSMPSTRPSRTTSVFTERASVDAERGDRALVRDRDVDADEPSAARPRTASASRSGGVGSGTYAQSSPSAANAAFCMRGESECSTGQPTIPTSVVVPRSSFTGLLEPSGMCQRVPCLPPAEDYAAAEAVLEDFSQNSSSLAVKKWWMPSGLRTK